MSGSTFRRPAPTKLEILELGRAFAAFAVVAHHAGQASDSFTSGEYGSLFHFGIYGVDFFFVLSGFIIYHVHQFDPKTPDAARQFLTKRLRRIYVPYLPIVVVLIAAYQALPTLSQGDRDWSWITSLTLIPTGSPPALSVAWTLVFEMTFYLVFLVFFYMTKRFWWLVVGWTLLTVLTQALIQPDAFFAPFSVLFDPLILEFVAGMVAAFAFGRMSPSQWRFPIVCGVLGVTVFLWAGDLHRVVIGLALAPMVLGLALAEVHRGLQIPTWALALGSASYAIYLIHNPIQSVVARLVSGHDVWLLAFVACSLAGIGVGLFYHLLFERPVLKMLGRKS